MRQTFTAPWLPAVSPVRMQELGRWWGGRQGRTEMSFQKGNRSQKKK